MNLEKLKFDDNGLIPVIVQDYSTGQVLMFAYANMEAIQKTIDTKRTHFWSRSRNKLWNKGEESGHFQDVKEIFFDCDSDTLLVLVDQIGVACHTGKQSCFFTSIDNNEKLAPIFSSETTMDKVFDVIEDRKQNPKEDSYVSKLFSGGIDKIAKKIGEEAGETIIASKNNDKKEITYEMADLWFHSLVLLSNLGMTPKDIYEELERRFGKKKKDYAISE